MLKSQHRFGFATVAVIIVVVVAIGGYGVYSQVIKDSSADSVASVDLLNTSYFRSTTTKTSSTDQNTTNKTPSATNTKPSKNVPHCNSIDCINKKFSNCSQATYTGYLNLGLLGGRVSVGYEILGKQSGVCRVKLVYKSNPNPEWENKPLICDYNTNKPLRGAVQEAMTAALRPNIEANCSGELMSVLSEIGSSTSGQFKTRPREDKDLPDRVIGPDGVYAQITNWAPQESALVKVSYGYKVGHADSACDSRFIGGAAGSLSAPIDTTTFKCRASTYKIKFYGRSPEGEKKIFEITKI